MAALVAQFVGFEFVSRQLFGSRLRYAVVQSLLRRTLLLARRGKYELHREGEKQSQPTEDQSFFQLFFLFIIHFHYY